MKMRFWTVYKMLWDWQGWKDSTKTDKALAYKDTGFWFNSEFNCLVLRDKEDIEIFDSSIWSCFVRSFLCNRMRRKIAETKPVYWYNCYCCGKKLKSETELEDPDTVICLACVWEYTPQGKERAEKMRAEKAEKEAKIKKEREERRQIELMKQAIREIEQEKG